MTFETDSKSPSSAAADERQLSFSICGGLLTRGSGGVFAIRRTTSSRRLAACPSHLFHLSQKPWNFASPPDTLSGMHKIIEIFADRAALHTEILALRQQVAVLKRKRPRPSLRKADRVFWVILSCLWPGWRHALVIVRPETVIGWHRKGCCQLNEGRSQLNV